MLKYMHNVPYFGHVVYQQTIWIGMKKDVFNYIARFVESQRIKVEHGNPTSLLQPLPIP